MISYQKFVVKEIRRDKQSGCFDYNWKDYFDSILLKKEHTTLKKQKTKYVISDENVTFSWQEYAKKVLWFGRRGGKNIYTTEIMEVTM